MTYTEFVDRTGYYPTDSQFKDINDAYMAGNDDKDMFCYMWRAEDGILKASKEILLTLLGISTEAMPVFWKQPPEI